MKNNTLRSRSDLLLEAANNFEEAYTIGHQLGEIGQLVRHMAMHMSDLQNKVDNQAEELKRQTSMIAEKQEEIEELRVLTGLMQKRTYYNKFVKEVFQKERGSDLIYPDFDEIYRRYFELIEERENIVKQLKHDIEDLSGLEFLSGKFAEGYKYATKRHIEIVEGKGEHDVG